jgi:hypothetical protein
MGGAFVRGDIVRPMRPWVIALALSVGCGPIAYIKQVPYGAADKVDRARELQADKYSPYWWTRAVLYLHMAREVAAHADYQGANHFGRLSSEAADKAAEEAEVAARDPSKRPVNPTKELAPAKENDSVAPAKE